MSWDHQMHAIKDRKRERESTHCSTAGKQAKQHSLSGVTASAGKWWQLANQQVVGKDAQTRQRLLKAKIVKSNHSRHNKKGFAVHSKRGHVRITITKNIVIATSRRVSQQKIREHGERKGRKKKEKKNQERYRRASMHQQVNLLSPSKALLSIKKIEDHPKPFRPIPSKQLISSPWEISRIEEVVYLLGFNSAA